MKVAVTGAAGGIGSEICRALEEEGHTVLGIDRDFEGLEAVDASSTHCIDLRDREEVEEFVENHSFEALVNCAGYQEAGAVEDIELGAVKQMFDDNVFGLLNIVQCSMPMLRENSGRVVNVSSIAGRITVPFYGVYSATKHSVEALSDALRMEVGQDVDVVIVEPGYIRTGFNVEGRKAVEKYMPGSVYSERYRDFIDNGEVPGTDAEVAAEKVVKALTDSRPDRRYTVTWLAWVAPKLKRFLPRKLYYFLLNRF
ncbi:MAG: SDR family NAD(P)-dependent oxidoreductase [Candidatus Nanohalobium sp.]